MGYSSFWVAIALTLFILVLRLVCWSIRKGENRIEQRRLGQSRSQLFELLAHTAPSAPAPEHQEETSEIPPPSYEDAIRMPSV